MNIFSALYYLDKIASVRFSSGTFFFLCCLFIQSKPTTTATNAMNMSRRATVTPAATGEDGIGAAVAITVGVGAAVAIAVGVGAAVEIVVGTAKQRSVLMNLLCVSINMKAF